MASKVIFTPEAADDLDRISRFIEVDSPDFAWVVCGEIVAAIDAWAAMPLASAILPERDDPMIRQRLIYNYRIVGRILPDAIKIVAVFHAAQDATPILDARL